MRTGSRCSERLRPPLPKSCEALLSCTPGSVRPPSPESPDKLRALADSVETLDHLSAPLAVIADRLIAAVSFLRARAEDLEIPESASDTGSRVVEPLAGQSPSAGVAARERLLVASLDYLVTPDDLVPDFQPGGYIDDVVLLAWVFGVATSELAPYLIDDPDDVESAFEES